MKSMGDSTSNFPYMYIYIYIYSYVYGHSGSSHFGSSGIEHIFPTHLFSFCCGSRRFCAPSQVPSRRTHAASVRLPGAVAAGLVGKCFARARPRHYKTTTSGGLAHACHLIKQCVPMPASPSETARLRQVPWLG